jgi:hypothetical protein
MKCYLAWRRFHEACRNPFLSEHGSQPFSKASKILKSHNQLRLLKKITIFFSDNSDLVVVLVVISHDLIIPKNHKYPEQNILRLLYRKEVKRTLNPKLVKNFFKILIFRQESDIRL